MVEINLHPCEVLFHKYQKFMFVIVVCVRSRSQLTTHNSQLTTHNSQLTTHNSQLTTHNSQLTSYT